MTRHHIGRLIVVLCAMPVIGFDKVGTVESAILPFVQESTPTSTIPMTVLWSQVDSERKSVTFALHNTGTKAITAWDVTITAGTGAEVRRAGHGVDAFREFAGLIERRLSIPPNGSVTATARLPRDSDNLTPVVVTPETVVFSDNSYAGEPRSANFIFEGRRAQLEAWQEIAQHLTNALRAATVNAAVLDQTLADIDASIALRGRDIVRSTFRANLSLGIADVRAGKAQVVATLNRLMAEANRNIAAAAAHSRR
jgi:hypothetical protein